VLNVIMDNVIPLFFNLFNPNSFDISLISPISENMISLSKFRFCKSRLSQWKIFNGYFRLHLDMNEWLAWIQMTKLWTDKIFNQLFPDWFYFNWCTWIMPWQKKVRTLTKRTPKVVDEVKLLMASDLITLSKVNF
jgi:hypothetical protein